MYLCIHICLYSSWGCVFHNFIINHYYEQITGLYTNMIKQITLYQHDYKQITIY